MLFRSGTACDDVPKGTWRSSILMVVVDEGSMVGGGVSDEIMAGVLMV